MKEFNPEMANAGASINEHKVYKVVHFGLWSCVAVGSYRVRYRVGEFIAAPKGTKFFVFDSLILSYRLADAERAVVTYADDFMHLDPDFRIWRATARGLPSAEHRVGDPKHSVDIEDFWRVYNRGSSYGVLVGHRTPSGTLWADEIRLDA
jgi:hypothetical protein